MAAEIQKSKLVSCKYENMQVEYHSKKNHVIGVVYETNKKIGKFLLGSDYLNDSGSSISGFRTVILSGEEIRRRLLHVGKDEDSDDDFFDLGQTKARTVFNRNITIPASSMTIACADENIKGSTLIEIVHVVINDKYRGMIAAVKASGKEADGKYRLEPKVTDGILSVAHPRDWFLTLGGWKGMASSAEVQSYYFNHSASSQASKAKFKGVQVFNNSTFPIEGPRISITLKGKTHFILGDNVVERWDSKETKPDLTYPKIGETISYIIGFLRLKDSQVAQMQLNLLKGDRSLFEQLKPREDSDTEEEVLKFLDYLNALIFGFEPSGINAALATGLMTLDLIVKNELSYSQAFSSKEGNGASPCACFTILEGSNEGTYNARNTIFTEKQKPKSMKSFRQDPSVSPVAVKEAMLIKRWLEARRCIQEGLTQQEQVKKIKAEIESLVNFYFYI